MQPDDLGGLIERFVSLSNGITLHIMERLGEGAPVVCLHGIWDSWRAWLPLLPDGPGSFAGRPLLMLDLRGHGESTKPPAGYAWHDYAADVIALIREQDMQRVTLVGHSLGALTALLVAAELPTRIASMVLEDPPLPVRAEAGAMFRGFYEMKRQPLEAIVDDMLAWRPDQTREQAELSARNLRDTADGVLEAMFSGTPEERAFPMPSRVTDAPTLVIRAGIAEQRALQPAGEALLRGVLPNLLVETVEGTGHTVLRDRPAAYRALLADVAGG
jgi:pimeloyl-ACP methyl ester carboxylesterase